jgi:hypothetical protein
MGPWLALRTFTKRPALRGDLRDLVAAQPFEDVAGSVPVALHGTDRPAFLFEVRLAATRRGGHEPAGGRQRRTGQRLAHVPLAEDGNTRLNGARRSPSVRPMVITCIILELIGWALPIGSAIVAYGRVYPNMPDPRVGEPTTYGAVERWMKHDIPDLFRSRRSALKWPALFAAFGLTCSTASSVLSLVFLTS